MLIILEEGRAVSFDECLRQHPLRASVELVRTASELRDCLAARSTGPLPGAVLLPLSDLGLEVLEWLRRQPTFRRIPVVLLAPDADHGSIPDAYAVGANSCVPAPKTPAEAAALLQAAVTFWVRHNLA